jgi:hypothetical protein
VRGLPAEVHGAQVPEAVLGCAGELPAGGAERRAGGDHQAVHAVAGGVRGEHSRYVGRGGDFGGEELMSYMLSLMIWVGAASAIK